MLETFALMATGATTALAGVTAAWVVMVMGTVSTIGALPLLQQKQALSPQEQEYTQPSDNYCDFASSIISKNLTRSHLKTVLTIS